MERNSYLYKISLGFASHPIVALIGPRQCGKTTLARIYAVKESEMPIENYFDLEDIADLTRLQNPHQALSRLKGLIIIDEIQRVPELFPALRVLVDKENSEQHFLILGSASRELIHQSSESLAGRIFYIELTPFTLTETNNMDRLWLRGGFPRSYLANDDQTSYVWRKSYIRTFLEQDIPSFGFSIEPLKLHRFWMMLAHYHGQICHPSELGRSLDMSHVKARQYLDILTYTLMIRQLNPWFENISKRQVKSPKIYFRDSGIFHTLLDIEKMGDLIRHPKLGASWEGMALEEVIRFHQVNPMECYFWSTHSQAELDLLLFLKGKRVGFEFKFSDAPKLTKSMQIAMHDLQLEQLFVIYPGKHQYLLADNIIVCSLEQYIEMHFN